MPQDTFTIRLIAKELDAALRGGKINKINQPGKEELSLIIYTGKRTLKLTVNANASDCGVYFTEDVRENPPVAPNFCMLLRKYLTGAEILGVETPGFERIFVFRLRCFTDFSSAERELRCEIMGKYSNVILTECGTVLGALKTTMLDENCKRAILPGAKYALPAPQDKIDPSDRAALAALFSEPPEDLSGFLFRRVAGLAPCTAEQIVKAYRGGDFAEHVYRYLFSDDVSPCVVEKNGVPTDFFARAAEGGTPYPTLCLAQSAFYEKRRARKQFEGTKRKLLSAILTAKKKHEKRLAQILAKQTECATCEENRIKGELLTSNLYALRRGMRSCELINHYGAPGETWKISLDETLSPSQNAQNYFKRYRKQKRTLEILAPQETEVRAELDYLSSLQALCETAAGEEDLRGIEEELLLAGLIRAQNERAKKRTAEVPYRTYECGGMRILSGRSNLQNDRLLRQSSPEDLWLHVRDYHSCHVVVKTGGDPVPDETLLYAARICARHSDAGGGGKVAVDYCKVKNVKKPPKSKAGFVTYSDYKTILVDPAESGG